MLMFIFKHNKKKKGQQENNAQTSIEKTGRSNVDVYF